MANVLPKDKQIAIISALAEGLSMRHVTVLHLPPAITPRKAVQVSIASDFREQANAES